MARRLFVYGTLAPDRAPAHLRDVTARMAALGAATVPGRLFDLGLYPAALLDESGGRVAGRIFDLPDDDTLWARLDDYEGVIPHQPAASLFRRQTCLARFDEGGEVECEIYVYNGHPPDSSRVGDGRWRPPAGAGRVAPATPEGRTGMIA